jgi:hypothetical protein
MQNAAGGGMPWWWNTHIDPNNLYYHFKALAEFGKGIDRRQWETVSVQQRLKKQLGSKEHFFELMGQQSSTLSIFWLCDAFGMHMSQRPRAMRFEGLTLELTDFADGSYRIEYWDTLRGVIISSQQQNAQGHRLLLNIPSFSNDIAFKIKKIN